MRIRTPLTALTIAALVAASAGAQTKTVTCKDGTTSTAVGKGACSGHGGVKKAEKTAAQAEKKIEKTEAKADQKVDKTADKAEKKIAKTEKKVAEVTCTDGTKSKGGRGACSGHGGIKKG